MTIITITILIILSALLTKIFCALAKGTLLMDKPNERSMHKDPVVRGGGAVFITLSVIAFIILSKLKHYDWLQETVLLSSIALLAAINFLDDLYNLTAKLRFSIQSLVAILIIYSTFPIHLDFVIFSLDNPIFTSVFLFLAIIWAINHFNFMDGLDGLCASQAVFLLVVYGLLFFVHQATIYQDFCCIFMACLLGFLIFNLPPAKLFMGDVGSATLGLITFSLAVIGQQKYNIPIIYWFILNGLFLFDTTLTLIRRILNKEKWFVAHRKHAYQRAKQQGISSPIILLVQAVINLVIFFIIWFLNLNQTTFYLALFLPLIILLCVYLLIELKKPMFFHLSTPNQNVQE